MLVFGLLCLFVLVFFTAIIRILKQYRKAFQYSL